MNVGGTVTQIAAGGARTCALLTTGNVRCWGEGFAGSLGYGNTNDIGDNETPASVGDVNIGATATQIAASMFHTCALLSTGSVRCWGHGTAGRLGYGNEDDVGDNETPASAGDVDIGATATQIARLEAMEEWTRSLSGVLTVGIGLEQALVATLRSTPAISRFRNPPPATVILKLTYAAVSFSTSGSSAHRAPMRCLSGASCGTRTPPGRRGGRSTANGRKGTSSRPCSCIKS